MAGGSEQELLFAMIPGQAQTHARRPVSAFEVWLQDQQGLVEATVAELGHLAQGVGDRAVSDFESEFQMALMNRRLNPDLETVFLVPALDLTYLSSSLVREVGRFGGNLDGLVAPVVAEALRQRFGA